MKNVIGYAGMPYGAVDQIPITQYLLPFDDGMLTFSNRVSDT